MDEQSSLDDIREYLKSSTGTARKRSALIAAAYLLYSFKTALNPIVTLLFIDYPTSTVDQNFKQQAFETNPFKVVEFVCLRTNCSRLSHSRPLMEDLASLHVLKLCYPMLGSLYKSPVMILDLFGNFVASMSAWGTLSLGAWPLIEQLVFKATNRTIMFVCAPELTTNQLRLQAKAYLDDLFASLDHFEAIQTEYNHNMGRLSKFSSTSSSSCSSSTFSSFSSSPPTCLIKRKTSYDDKTMWLVNCHKQQLKNKNNHKRETSSLQLKPFDRKYRRPTDDMVTDCLPLIRSAQWQPQFVRLYYYTTLLGVAIMGLVVLLVFIYIEHKILIKKRKYLEYSHLMSASNCSLWLADRPERPLELNKVSFSWTLFSFTEMAVMNMTPALGVALMLVYYHIGFACEVRLWLKELRVHLLNSRLVSVKLDQSRYREDEKLDPFRLVEQTKDAMLRSTKFAFVLPYQSAGPVKRLSGLRNFHPDEVIRDLEVVYVQFRLFLEHVASCAPSGVIIITLSYLLNYGTLIIGIMFARLSHGDNIRECSFTIVFAFVVANTVLLIPANMHAKVSEAAR